jgi:hypothetical protein
MRVLSSKISIGENMTTENQCLPEASAPMSKIYTGDSIESVSFWIKSYTP